jgi:hypothetical protein
LIKVFVASTGQDVGKTTLCLGLIEYFRQRYGSCGYMKPVGQKQLSFQNVYLDKDALLVKQYFGLKDLENLSPIAAYPGFTKAFLDGKISIDELHEKLNRANQQIHTYTAMVYEGTGHMGVGSIFSLSNADVAKALKCPVILVTKGGLGSSFDELMLSVNLCQKNNIPIIGVVLNKVIPDKKEEISSYFKKALKNENIPYLGSLPFDLFLSQPTFKDIEHLFDTQFSNSELNKLLHIQHFQIISFSAQIDELQNNTCIIVSSEKESIIYEICEFAFLSKINIAVVICGKKSPSDWLIQEMKKFNTSYIYTEEAVEKTLLSVSEFQAKITFEDAEKIKEAIDLTQNHIDFKMIENFFKPS